VKTQLCCRIDLHLVQRWKLAYTTVVDCVVAVLRGGCHDHDGAEIATCAGRARSSCCMPPSRQASRRPSGPALCRDHQRCCAAISSEYATCRVGSADIEGPENAGLENEENEERLDCSHEVWDVPSVQRARLTHDVTRSYSCTWAAGLTHMSSADCRCMAYRVVSRWCAIARAHVFVHVHDRQQCKHCRRLWLFGSVQQQLLNAVSHCTTCCARPMQTCEN